MLDATGISDLLDKAAETILSSFPDIGILDGLVAKLEGEVLEPIETYLRDKIEAPFAAITALLNDPAFPLELTQGTPGDDVLQGGINDRGALQLDGLAGNDILTGGLYDDTLNGGDGRDMLIGGAGDDLLIGGANTEEDPEIAVYDGNIRQYGIARKLVNGLASGTWFVSDYRTEAQISAAGVPSNTGTDELRGIELLFFKGEVLGLRNFDTYIFTNSADGTEEVVSPTFTTLDPVGGVQRVTTDVGNDVIIGFMGRDVLSTGGGNDHLESGSNGSLTTNGLMQAGDFLDGGLDNDIYVIGANSAGYDVVYDIGGVDTVDYKNSIRAVNVFLGSTQREMFYRPDSVFFDGSPQGWTLTGNADTVGVLFGIENVIGTTQGDILIGSDAVNNINGGTGHDQIRGLDGDDILLGGKGNDTLIGDGGDDFLDGGEGANEYIGGLGDDRISDITGTYGFVKYSADARTDHYNQSVDFVEFQTTGFGVYDPLDMPGGIVVLPTSEPGQQQVSKYITSVVIGDRFGVDYLDRIEGIVGSTGRDIIVSSRAVSQTIYGGEGDDDLSSDVGETQNRFYGGEGNDLFVSDSLAQDTFFGGEGSDTVRVWGDNTIEGDLLFGDDNRATPLAGIDVLDFSGSVFSWHLYMNPGAPNGNFVGKTPLSSLSLDDPRFIQPTLGVNGVVEKLPGVVVPGETYPGISQDLRVPDPNSPNAGGEANNIGEFEHIIGSAQRDIIAGGSPDGAMTIEGRDGDDVLYAGQGFSSTLEGGDGNDVLGTFNHTLGTDDPISLFNAAKLAVLRGGDGDDVFVAGDFREAFDGGDGYDMLSFEVSTAAVSVDLQTGVLENGYATGDALTGGIEHLTGSQFDDVLAGDAGANDLIGWDGNDTIHGNAGQDLLFGNDGDDQLFGDDGDDILHGGNGADLLDGGDGNDVASWNFQQSNPKEGLVVSSQDVVHSIHP